MIENYRSELVWNDDAQARRICVAASSAPASPAAGSTRPAVTLRRARGGAALASRASRGCGGRLLRSPAAAGATTDAASLRFWAMGREGEVVAELLPRRSSARIPASASTVQQLPWTAAHEKLLTAFAGDALPDVCQLGNTWIPEFAALGALEPLDARDRRVRASLQRDDYFAGIWDTN